MIRLNSIFKSIFIIYIAWLLIIVPRGVWVVYTGDFKANAETDIFQFFVTMLITMTIIIHGIGLTLAWFTQKGNN